MKVDQKKMGVILSYISLAVTVITGLLYTPIMLRILGQNEYGLYQLVSSVVAYLSLLNLGLTGSYIRFYTKEKYEGDADGEAKLNGMFLLVFLAISIIATVIGAILLFNIHILGDKYSSEEYQTATFLMVFMLVNIIISFPNGLFVAYMSANERFVFPRSIMIITNIAIPLINLPVLYWGYGSRGLVVISTFMAVICFLMNIAYCVVKLHMQFCFHGFRSGLLKELMGFTFFIFLSDIVDQLNTNVDKFLLGRILGPVSVAIYSVGFNLKTYYTQISWAIPEVFVPQFNRLVEERKDEELDEMFIKVGRVSNLVLAPVILGFILYGKEFIFLWAGKDYHEAYYVTVILMLAAYVPSIQSIGVNIQNAMNKHKVRSWVYFAIAVINVLVSIQLIPKFGVIGTSLGTLFANILGNIIFMNIYYHKEMGLNMFAFWKAIFRFVPALMLSAVGGILIGRVFMGSGWLNLGIQIILFMMLYFVFMWYLGMNQDEKELLIGVKRKFIKK